MVIDEHKAIFIHIPKCGGTSVEKFFNVHPNRFNIDKLTGKYKGYQGKYLQHCTYLEMKTLFNIPVEEYYTFTVIRNPWDKIVSSFFYEIRYNKNITSFKKFVQSPVWENEQHSIPQCEYIMNEKGEIKVDFICRFENLQQDFDMVCNRISINTKELPHKNKTAHEHYTEYYDNETRSIIAERYAKDISRFGYIFGE